MTIILGVFYHFLGGFACGSFYLPFKRVRLWGWESYWIVGGLFSWLIVPWIAAALTVPNYSTIIAESADSTLVWTYVMGVLWGIGGLTFGLAMRYLGISLGMSVALGFCSSFGALIPPVYRDVTGVSGETLSGMLHAGGGRLVIIGILVCLAGIAMCGWAGMSKERELDASAKQATIKEFNLTRGLSVAIFSGILSACFNFGIEAGQPLAQLAVERGNNPLFQTNVIYVVLLWGGLTTNLIWCILLNLKNKTFKNYIDAGTPLANNYLFSALAGMAWFLQFFFYGMGASKLTNGASSWILHMAFIIMISNVWGMVIGEWRGVSQSTLRKQLLGFATIICSVAVVGYGNSVLESAVPPEHKEVAPVSSGVQRTYEEDRLVDLGAVVPGSAGPCRPSGSSNSYCG